MLSNAETSAFDFDSALKIVVFPDFGEPISPIFKVMLLVGFWRADKNRTCARRESDACYFFGKEAFKCLTGGQCGQGSSISVAIFGK